MAARETPPHQAPPDGEWTAVSMPQSEFSADESQPQAVSDRACTLVINSFARYPQTFAGSVIVADQVLDRLDSNGVPSTGIGLRELALMTIDSKRAAAEVNKIHDAFQIPYRVTPKQASAFVRRTTVAAIETIRKGVLAAATELGISVPERLDQPTLIIKNVFKNDSSINVPMVFDLEQLLVTRPDLRDRLAKVVKADADELRAESSARQLWAKNKPRKVRHPDPPAPQT